MADALQDKLAAISEELASILDTPSISVKDRKRARKLMRRLSQRGRTALAKQFDTKLRTRDEGARVEPRESPSRRALVAEARHAESLLSSVQTLRPLESMIATWFAQADDLQDKAVRAAQGLKRAESLVRSHNGGATTQLSMELESAHRRLLHSGDAPGRVQEVSKLAVRVLAELPACALALGIASQRALPEPVELSPERAGELRRNFEKNSASRRAPAVRAVSIGEMLLLWELFVSSQEGRWIDLGSGDGVSLARFAELNPKRSLLGVDLRAAPTVANAGGASDVGERLPDNASFLELNLDLGSAPGSGDKLAAATVEQLGPASARTVSILYPLHAKQRRLDGTTQLAHEAQLATAVQLLEAGGSGFIATEDPTAFRTALAWLCKNDAIASVSYSDPPLQLPELSELGITGFAPTYRDVFGSGGDEPDKELGRFSWALCALFRLR